MTDMPAGMLEPGEKVLWTGAPDGQLFLGRLLLRGVVAGVAVFVVVAWLWPMTGLTLNGWAKPGIGLVLFVLFALLCWRMSVLSNRAYAVTDRRALIWRREGLPKLWFFPIQSQTELLHGSGKRGRLSLSNPAVTAARQRHAFSFEYLSDLPSVTALVQKVQRGGA